MNFDLDALLTAIASFRSYLEDWGVTTQMLLIAAGLSTLVSILSLREVLLWFLKLQTINDEVKNLRLEVRELRHSLEKTQDLLMSQSSVQDKKPTIKPAANDAPAFRFDN